MDPSTVAELRSVVQRLRTDPGGGFANGVFLGGGEHELLSLPAVLWTVQTRRRNYRSGGASLRIPIVAGMSVRVGGSSGRGEQELPSAEPSDTGTFVLTDRRAMYLGSVKTDEVPLSRLLAVHLDDSAGVVVAHVSRRKSPLIVQPASGQAERLASHFGLAVLISSNGIDAADQALASTLSAARPTPGSIPGVVPGGSPRPIIPMSRKSRP